MKGWGNRRYTLAMEDGQGLQHDSEDDGGLAVVIPSFSGPLDLLLHLIRKNDVSIYDIPISSICEQYQNELRNMQIMDLDLAGEFIWMAAWLLDLKSRTLLPRASSKDDESDPRMELVERLLEYRRVKEVAAVLYDFHVVRRCLWEPDMSTSTLSEDIDIDWEDVDLRILARSYLSVMERFATTHPPPLEVKPLRYRVEDTMRDLYDRVHDASLIPLIRLLDSTPDPEEVVALVVATLELVRLGGVCAEQRRVFAEIYLRPGPRQFRSEHAFKAEPEEVPFAT